ncbi:putative chloramphenical resistance permease RarD [Bordetella ansorpii]|uniref:Putative chloramphenical resistance permease RarD n=1 Tax=Bordetella ansorpii TaxID=288768 RepID=A0A157SEW5_9BORD|nr:rarD protein [Bordetella ansorpii]SAI68919.1 putative chloramphenical resistance permease RarD [Bordetella ansorpii]
MTQGFASRHAYGLAAASGVTANVLLGASSLYWRELGSVAPTTLVAYRILVSLLTLLLVMWAGGLLRGLATLLARRVVLLHALAAALVVVNWGTFIWASIHGRVVESGLGYLIAPCIAIGLGIVLYRERPSRWRVLALAVIAISLGLLLTRSGELTHWVYLVIGTTWGLYAWLKKLTPLDAFSGLLVETLVLAVACAALLLGAQISLAVPPDFGAASYGLLALCGVVSVLPLALFAFAAGRLPLSLMGFFQFVLPTTQLVVAIWAYEQTVTPNTLWAFGMIWLALVAMVLEPLMGRRPANQALGGER